MLGITKNESLAEKSARLKSLIARRRGEKVAPKSEPEQDKKEPVKEPEPVKASTPTQPKQVAPTVEEKGTPRKGRPRRITNPGGSPRRPPRPKRKVKSVRKQAPSKPKPRKWVKAKEAAEPVQRMYRTGKNNLFALEYRIIDLVKASKGEPVSIQDIARELLGSNVISEAHTKGAGLRTVRTIRNAVRKPIASGYLKRWTKEDSPDATPGYVCFVKDAPPPEKPKKKRIKRRVKVSKKKASKKTAKAVTTKRRTIVGSRKTPAGITKSAKTKVKEIVKNETRKAFKKEEKSSK